MRLNGWQRLWVVASVLWTVPIAFLFFTQDPSPYVFHVTVYEANPRYNLPAPQAKVRMKTPVWKGQDCVDRPGVFNFAVPLTFPELSDPVYLCFDAPTLEVGDRKMQGGVTSEWDGKAWREVRADPAKPATYETINTAADQKAIEADYRHAYAEKKAHVRWTQNRNIALLWVIPPIALYVLGWAFAWVWVGFRKS